MKGEKIKEKLLVRCPCPHCKNGVSLPPSEFEDGCIGIDLECPYCHKHYEVNAVVIRELFKIKVKPFKVTA